jgi:hypothetical protein
MVVNVVESLRITYLMMQQLVLMVVDVIEHHWMFDEVEGEQNYHSHC